MSENYNSKYNLKLLGSVISIILFIILSYNYFMKGNINLIIVAILSITIVITLFLPNALKPLNIILINVGLFLGKILNPIILSIIYLTVMIPTALFVKLFIKDPMKRKFEKDKKTYWIESNKDSFDFDNQF